MKRVFLALTLLVVSGLPLQAVSVWTETGAQIDETVADQNTTPPLKLMQPLLARVPFSNFRYPHVDQNEDVTFIADDPVYSKKTSHHGIYRSIASSGELVPLVRQGETAVPGTSIRLDWFRGLQMDGPDFVFNATDDADHRGLYYWSKGVLKTIARNRETIVPGTHEPLRDVEYGALSAGRILYNARTSDENLLVLYSLADQRAQLLSRTGAPIPSRSGQVFRYFSPQNWLDPSNIVFRGASVVDPHKTSAASTRGIYGWFGINWSKTQDSLGQANLRTLADGISAVPLLDKTKRFDDFRSAPVKDGLLGFVGRGPGFSGVYYCDLASGEATIRPVVDTESQMQGLFAGGFRHFGIFCTVFDKSIVFVGYAEKDYVGVFLYRIDHDELFLLTDNRAPLNDKRIRDFEIAGHFLVRDRFAVSAEFEDGSYGVYMATIPNRAFKRMMTPTD